MVSNVVIKFGWTPMKIVGEVAFWKIPAAYGPVLRKIANSIIFAIFGRSPKKWQPVRLWYLVWNLDELDKNWERSRVLKIVKLEILQSAPNDPKPNSRNWTSKVPYPCALWYPESQIFVRFALQLAVFEIIHIVDLPIDSHVKFQSATKYSKPGQLPRRVIALFHHGS